VSTVGILALAQFFGAFGQVATVLLAGLIGNALAPDPALATVPVGTAVIGVAAATVPVGLALQRWGRRRVLIAGTLFSAGGCLLAAWALQRHDFALYCVATLVVGANLAFTAQYRFAAAEAVAPADAGRAVTRVMLGTLGAAFVSPWLAVASRDWVGAEFTGSYLTLAAVFVLNFLALLAYRDSAQPAPAADGDRPLRDILRQPAVVVAVAAAAVAYGVMALLMTATPISMHVHHGHSVEDTAFVLQSHVIGMYAPSFVTGLLLTRFGIPAILAAGIAANALCAALALSGEGLLAYWSALTLLGVGWNLLFVAGTALLAGAYRPGERFRVQAANDFLMFGVMAVASLGAGPLLALIGWRGLNELALALLAALGLLVAARGRPGARAAGGAAG
jgi:predicted MFS family arabinose efflux permease